MSSKNVLIVTCGVCGQELGRAEGDAAFVTHGLCNCAPPEMIEESADEDWITVRWSDGTEERGCPKPSVQPRRHAVHGLNLGHP